MPVIEALAPHVRVSIDTRHAAVAEAAIAAGATLVNDVSASLAPVAAAAGPASGSSPCTCWATRATMQDDPRYDDVVAEVPDFLVDRAEAAVAAGVEEVWIDPGIGFGKTLDAQPRPARRTSTSWSPPASRWSSARRRKRFLGMLLGGSRWPRTGRAGAGRSAGGFGRHGDVGDVAGCEDGPGPRRAGHGRWPPQRSWRRTSDPGTEGRRRRRCPRSRASGPRASSPATSPG